MKLTLREKLHICYGVFFPKGLFCYHAKDKNKFIFNNGYSAGWRDNKLPGLYKVTTCIYKGNKSYEYFFDNLDEAIDFIERFYSSSTDKGDSCDFVQTYLDRDLGYLIK